MPFGLQGDGNWGLPPKPLTMRLEQQYPAGLTPSITATPDMPIPYISPDGLHDGISDEAAMASADSFSKVIKAAAKGYKEPPTRAEAWAAIIAAVVAFNDTSLLHMLQQTQATIEAKLAQHDATKLKDLELEHDKVYAECRAMVEQLRDMRSREAEIQNRINNLVSAIQKGRSELSEVDQSAPVASDYPTREEILKFQTSRSHALGRLNHTLGLQRQFENELEQVTLASRALQDKFAKLQEREQQLKGQVEALKRK